jgi:hypothetical protein
LRFGRRRGRRGRWFRLAGKQGKIAFELRDFARHLIVLRQFPLQFRTGPRDRRVFAEGDQTIKRHPYRAGLQDEKGRTRHACDQQECQN